MLFQCIPHSLIKNKVLAQMIATLTQLSTQREVFNKDSGPIFADFCTQLLTASLWVNLAFGRSYAPEKTLLTHPFKLKVLAKLCAGTGEFMVFPTFPF